MLKFLKKNKLFYIVIALVITIFFSVDRWLKLIALNQIGKDVKLISNIFVFHFSANPYLAFSLPLNTLLINILVTVITLLLLVYIIYFLIKKQKKQKNTSEIILLSIILIGAFSNLFDRLYYGYVIDYLELKYFTVFNIADLMISSGALILILKNLKNTKRKI